MKISKNYKFNIPELSDVADISKFAENFNIVDDKMFQVEQAIQSFDALADTYGYTYEEKTVDGVTTHTEVVKPTSPVTAKRITVEGNEGGYDTFTITITLGNAQIKHKVTVRDTTAEMEVL